MYIWITFIAIRSNTVGLHRSKIGRIQPFTDVSKKGCTQKVGRVKWSRRGILNTPYVAIRCAHGDLRHRGYSLSSVRKVTFMNKYLYAFLSFLFRFFILTMMGTLIIQLFNSLLYELADKENPHPFSLLLSIKYSIPGALIVGLYGVYDCWKSEKSNNHKIRG